MVFQTGYAQQFNSLSQSEANGIVHMREEEKLARDVYDSLFAKWETNPFGNIRKSEQVHMDRMKALIETYQLQDPVTQTGNKPGLFMNATLQKYYNELLASGTQSVVEALKAGAKIEELDISDLISYAKHVNKKDILDTYSYLKKASENHLRAFVGRLKVYGINYAPLILDPKEFQNIIDNY